MDLWLAGLFTVVILAIFLLTRPRRSCPECHSKQVSVVAKKPLGMHGYDIPQGGDGGKMPVQMRYQTTFYCQQCESKWVKTTTETSY